MITIEPIIYSVRIGENNFKMYDNYTAVCTAIKASPDTIRIASMSGQATLKQMILLSKKFKDLGFNYLVWERIKDGQCKELKRKL